MVHQYVVAICLNLHKGDCVIQRLMGKGLQKKPAGRSGGRKLDAIVLAGCGGAPRRSRFSIGTDFSGMETPILTLRRFPLKFHHKWSCEKEPSCVRLIRQLRPDRIFLDIARRKLDDTEYVDLLVTGFPCQPFSQGGKGEGIRDPRGILWAFSLEFILQKRPKAVMAENVANFPQRFAAIRDTIWKALVEAGYICEEKVLNTADYGLPQNRPRWYLVAIRSDAYRAGEDCLQTVFPAPLPFTLLLQDIVRPLPASVWAALPPRSHKQGRKNVIAAYTKMQAHGENPFIVPAVVDCNSSVGFAGHMVERCPCLTRSRAGQLNGYRCSTKGGVLECRGKGFIARGAGQ